VAGTPTFFINEVLHRGGYDRHSLERALSSALASSLPERELQGEPV
jgi:hypothetical protein